MYSDLDKNKASLFSLLPVSTPEKIEAYYSDEIKAIWKSNTQRNWGIYEQDSKLSNNWEQS